MSHLAIFAGTHDFMGTRHRKNSKQGAQTVRTASMEHHCMVALAVLCMAAWSTGGVLHVEGTRATRNSVLLEAATVERHDGAREMKFYRDLENPRVMFIDENDEHRTLDIQPAIPVLFGREVGMHGRHPGLFTVLCRLSGGEPKTRCCLKNVSHHHRPFAVRFYTALFRLVVIPVACTPC